MICEVTPSVASGTVQAPGSKSMTHRLLICGGLAQGESVVHGVSLSSDIRATLDCLSALGATYTYHQDDIRIAGCDPKKNRGAILSCRESASTLRFFLPLCLLSGYRYRMTGSNRLMQRPLSVYQSLCNKEGFLFSRSSDGKELVIQGNLKGKHYVVPGDVSSQFISGLLFALPLAEGDSIITVTGKAESVSYVGMTRETLSRFGIFTEWQGHNTLYIPGGQKYISREAVVEGDYSNAAFFEALNLLGGNVTVTGLNPESIQGDRVYQSLFPFFSEEYFRVSLTDCPDLGPVLFALAAATHGGEFTGIARLRLKESDRVAVMAEELLKFGVPVTIEDNRMFIPGGCLHAPTAELDGHSDHRVVMALAVLLTKYGGRIRGAEAVDKSFPDFWRKLSRLGVKVKTFRTGETDESGDNPFCVESL